MNDIEILEQQAIDAAIQKNWQKAIELNKKILKIDKKNTDACIRLAFAFLQANKINEAKKYYNIALKLQPGNRTIIENLERIKILQSKKNKKTGNADIILDPNLFLEIPGKTKSISLVNLGQKNILAQLVVGQKVILVPKKRKVEIRTQNKDYIGSLPDDISKRLTIFIKAGSKFCAYIQEANLNRIVVFIREEKKGKKVAKYTSFPTNIQSKLNEMSKNDETSTDEEEETEDLSEIDLEKLAETLTGEEKEYFPFENEEPETEEIEE